MDWPVYYEQDSLSLEENVLVVMWILSTNVKQLHRVREQLQIKTNKNINFTENLKRKNKFITHQTIKTYNNMSDRANINLF